MSPQFLYVFTPGPRPELATDLSSWTDEDEVIADAHVAHLEAGAAAGKVVVAGRSQDGIGPAIVILDVESEAEAREFMNADPFVSENLFGAELHPFHIAFGRLA